MTTKTRWIVECHLKNGGTEYVAKGDCEFTADKAQAKRFRTYNAACKDAVVWYDVANISWSDVVEEAA